ncbi:hypothetical protein [Streptomyces sp. NPDC002215]|uniref:hypothetical protein n=1 Tax=Streptomyces sp. NPDC002215 TaxID=3154412 RepID=UPI003321FC79
MTTGFAAPDPAPPAPSTRVLFTTCMDLVTTPWLDAVRRRDPAVSDLRQFDRRLRDQREDRHRADTLLTLTGGLIKDYGSR